MPHKTIANLEGYYPIIYLILAGSRSASDLSQQTVSTHSGQCFLAAEESVLDWMNSLIISTGTAPGWAACNLPAGS